MGTTLKDKMARLAPERRAGAWWIGGIEEVPGVNCRERTRQELLETLRITLAEALELNRREAAST